MTSKQIRIYKLYRPWASPLYKGFPQRNFHILKRIRDLGYRVEEFEITPYPTPWLHLSYFLGILFSLARFKKVKASIIITDDVESTLLGILIKYFFNIPFLFDFIDDYAEIIRFQKQTIRYHLAKWIEKAAPRIADRVVVVDQKKLEFCLGLNLPREKIVLIPNGYDSAMFKPEPWDRRLLKKLGVEDRKVVIFIGKLNKYYNIEVIIKAMSILHLQIPDIKCLLVGEGDDSQNLKKLTCDLKLENCISFVGPLPHKEIPKLVNLSEICLFSLPDESALALYEYMACGKAVVVPKGNTKKMAIPKKVFPDDCLLRVANTPEGFATGILYLLNNPDAARKMGRKARERIDHLYSWNRLSQLYIDVIKSCLHRESADH